MLRGFVIETRRLLAPVALASVLALTCLPTLRADDDRAECQHRIEKAEHKLAASIRRHGEHSPQAESRRVELKAQRERCYNRIRRWWDGHEHRWHEDRDWDH